MNTTMYILYIILHNAAHDIMNRNGYYYYTTRSYINHCNLYYIIHIYVMCIVYL
jgi:hypothetical protein